MIRFFFSVLSRQKKIKVFSYTRFFSNLFKNCYMHSFHNRFADLFTRIFLFTFFSFYSPFKNDH